jgi:hypothetical protein
MPRHARQIPGFFFYGSQNISVDSADYTQLEIDTTARGQLYFFCKESVGLVSFDFIAKR